MEWTKPKVYKYQLKSDVDATVAFEAIKKQALSEGLTFEGSIETGGNVGSATVKGTYTYDAKTGILTIIMMIPIVVPDKAVTAKLNEMTSKSADVAGSDSTATKSK